MYNNLFLPFIKDILQSYVNLKVFFLKSARLTKTGATDGFVVQHVCRGEARGSHFLPLLVILVFGAMFEDAGELCIVEVALLVDGSLPK